jgi:hypothetical protein
MSKRAGGGGADSTREAGRGEADLPHALTFFLTRRQRLGVLAALKRRSSGGRWDRAEALCRALGVPAERRGERGR